MELLREVGHDVDYWSINADGSVVETPAANPNYCYNWSFGSATEGIVLCVWHSLLREEEDRIVYSEPMRRLNERLLEVASNPNRSATDRNRARKQATRARAFYRLVQLAYDQLLPVRLIIGDGDKGSREEPGANSENASHRKLDDELWYVHKYDEQAGEGLLVRGIKPARDVVDVISSQPSDDDRGPEDVRQLRAIQVRRGQRDFRDRLLSAWSRRCVVTECRIEGLLEAAHIVPHAEEPDYRTSNGLLLRADIHTLYDLGLLSIDEFMRVHLAPELKASEYRNYEGKRIQRLPDRIADTPSSDALRRRHAAFLSPKSHV